MSWQPTATLEALRARAEVLHTIRQFFAERGVLEVETPALSQHSVTSPHIQSIRALYQRPDGKSHEYFLQTSPEYAMKRLLASGSGAIYQVCKSFRNGDQGEQHNPEFTLLEWYRPGFNLNALMDEVDALLQTVLKVNTADRISYQNLFCSYLNLDPLNCTVNDLKKISSLKGIHIVSNTDDWDKDSWLNLLMGHLIEPHLGLEKPIFVFDFPESQAALARTQLEHPELADRFEVYTQGMELANGFYELADAKEQRQRFELDQQQRAQLGYAPMSIDERLLLALTQGLPDCSGVALGIDRLMMALLHSQKIAEVMSFDWLNA